MKKVWKKKGNKYVKRWTLEEDDWIALVVVLLTLNYVVIRLLVGSVK